MTPQDPLRSWQVPKHYITSVQRLSRTSTFMELNSIQLAAGKTFDESHGWILSRAVYSSIIVIGTQIESLTSHIFSFILLYNECEWCSFCTEGPLRYGEQGEPTFSMVAPFWLLLWIKVKDNNHELIRVSRRIEHVVLSIEESRDCNIIRSDEYNDALTTIFEYVSQSRAWGTFVEWFLDSLIICTQRVAQRLLKRNLGDRTWNASEISSELRRLNDDVQTYLSVHTVSHVHCTFRCRLTWNWSFGCLTSYSCRKSHCQNCAGRWITLQFQQQTAKCTWQSCGRAYD